MRTVTPFVAVACVLSIVLASAGPVAGSQPPLRLRSDNQRIQEVIRFALARSASFRDLIATLDLSDRIVYIEEGPCLERDHRACLYLMPNGRDVVIHINPRQPVRGAATTLAHELYHVAEIERASDVVDAATLRALYERIGERSCGSQSRHTCWETRAAQAFERLVMRQLAGGKTDDAGQTRNKH